MIIDPENRDHPICPWCGHENSSELLHPTVTRVVMGCAACNKAMDVIRNTTITFTTKKLFSEPVIGIAGATVTAQPERGLLIQMVQRELIAKGSTTLEVTEEMLAERKRRAKGRKHPGGCGRLTNAGYCGLDWYDSNHKPVVCNHCKKIKL